MRISHLGITLDALHVEQDLNFSFEEAMGIILHGLLLHLADADLPSLYLLCFEYSPEPTLADFLDEPISAGNHTIRQGNVLLKVGRRTIIGSSNLLRISLDHFGYLL